jgi:peptidoglycan/xylan/chitin deacetylase (PgdA/CDA1 family)
MSLPLPVRNAGRRAFRLAHGLDVARLMNRRALRILVWHRFPDSRALRESLDAQCAHLRRHYHPVSLTEAGRSLREGRPLPPNAVVLTVDDGYRDFLTTAYPVFYRYRLPVTVYLACDFLDGRMWMMGDYIRYAVERAAAGSIEIGGVKMGLRSREERLRAVAWLKDQAKGMPEGERLALLKALPDALGVEMPARPPACDAPLAWHDVRSLAAGGLVEFGAHTVTHPILSRLAGPSEVEREVAGSKARIEQEVRRRVVHFCYPNGMPEDIPEGAADAVRAAGYETAVTTSPGLNLPGADRFLLRRIAVNSDYPAVYFEQLAAGLRP